AASAALGDEHAAARAAVIRIRCELQTDPRATAAGALADAERAIAVLERFGDQEGLVRGWMLHGTILFYLGHPERARPSFERATAVAKEVGDHRLLDQTALGPVVAATYGHMPASDGIVVCEDVLEWVRDPTVRSMVLQKRARLEAAAGRRDAAQASYAEC